MTNPANSYIGTFFVVTLIKKYPNLSFYILYSKKEQENLYIYKFIIIFVSLNRGVLWIKTKR